MFPKILPCKRESPVAFPTHSPSPIRSTVPSRDIPDPLARLSAAVVVQILVVESRDGGRKLFYASTLVFGIANVAALMDCFGWG